MHLQCKSLIAIKTLGTLRQTKKPYERFGRFNTTKITSSQDDVKLTA